MTSSAPGIPDSTSSTPEAAGWTADRIRLWSFVCAVLLAPAAWAASFLSLVSATASRCLTYGEQCPSPVPDLLLWTPLTAAGIAFLTVLLLPERTRHAGTARLAAFTAQLVAEAFFLTLIALPG
ncbi:hypothetical protein [Streptomyces sp. NPDC014894]|uniref:hypothetical protein n=1 Tax=unclassified Streptomyces TaxID=2593676 RepID=UPI0036F5B8FE